jgi:hypothetical protein
MICRFIIPLGVALSASMFWAQDRQALTNTSPKKQGRPNVVVLLVDDLGKENTCPIEFRNFFIREIKSAK